MERNYLSQFDLFSKKISHFLSKLQRRSRETKTNPETLKVFKGLTFAFLSLLGAWVSIELTSKRSNQSFQKNHWVPKPTWSSTLKTYGFQEKQELGNYGKLLESNPAAFSSEAGIWLNEEHSAILLTHSPYQNGSELWLSQNQPKPGPWTRLGSGLTAFENLVKLLENLPPRAPEKSHSSRKIIDPKEFHY